MPPLRERGDDVLMLAHHTLTGSRAAQGVPTPHLTQRAQEALLDYEFPGNVRELREHSRARADAVLWGARSTWTDLQLRGDERPARGSQLGAGAPLGTQLEEIERDAIVKALEQTRYNKTAAAKRLGITFRALRYRIKKLGID